MPAIAAVAASASCSCSPDSFAPLALAARKSLIRYADSVVGEYFGEDIVQDAILFAMSNLDQFDFRTGAAGAHRWLFRIADLLMSSKSRGEAIRKARELKYIERWQSDAMNEKGRVALLEEAKTRFPVIQRSLSSLEEEALAGFIEGDSDVKTAKRLGTSRRNVNRAKLDALDKCKRSADVERPDLPAALWRAKNWTEASQVTIYHAPQKTGAGLAKMTPGQREANLRAA